MMAAERHPQATAASQERVCLTVGAPIRGCASQSRRGHRTLYNSPELGTPPNRPLSFAFQHERNR